MKLLNAIHNWDLKAFHWCLQRPNRSLAIPLARVCSYTANGPLYVLAGLLFVLLQNWPMVQLLIIGFALERCCYFLFKSLFRRGRPTVAIPGYRSVIEPSDTFSFPSGHTSAAFLVTATLTWAYPGLAWLLYPWALGVGVSRVVLGVHFPSDTIAGAILGYGIGSLLIIHLMT